jgi:acyl carrier protein
MRPVPVGVPGELYAGGAGVARGYLNRAALTAEKFVPDPFGAEPGARLYRTGDRVRWTDGAVVEYLGRLDGQVKVRGFRIEPGEIEAVLRRHPGVADCTLVARPDARGDRRLVAYVVGAAGADELRPHLRRSLPEYMVPAAFVHLSRLPLSPNGKVDRAALPAPEPPAAGRRLEPETEMESRVAALWCELLDLPAVGVEESFFDLGGHSLLLVRLQARLAAELGSELSMLELFQHPSVRSLAARLQGAAAGGEAGRERGGARLAGAARLAARRRR